MELKVIHGLYSRMDKQKHLHKMYLLADYDIKYYHNQMNLKSIKSRACKIKSYADKFVKFENKKDEICIKLWKVIRSIFLHLNRNKKYIFGFNTKSRKLWPAMTESKERLLQNCYENLKECDENKEKKKSLILLIKTLKSYKDDYGLTIGLVLNRKFYWPIPNLIYEYL